MSRRGGQRRPPHRPYYPNQRFRQFNDSGYNFSSDVNMDMESQGGSFVYGGEPPPMQHFQPPHRGMGYGPPPRGFRGGFPPQFGYGGPPRGFRPPGPFRGRKRGYRHGRNINRPPHLRQQLPEGEDPYYHPSMFEDPWRYLLPKVQLDSKEGDKESAKDTGELGNSQSVAGGGGGGERAGVEGKTRDEVEKSRTDGAVDQGEVEGGEKKLEGLDVAAVEADASGEVCGNGEEEKGKEGGDEKGKEEEREEEEEVGKKEVGAPASVKAVVGEADLPKEDEITCSTAG